MQRLGRVVGNMLAVMLTVFSIHAMADAQLAGRDFNHSATGFPLTGGHATAACETCHVAGVFKGTAKTCDGCHALGKRVVATPMPTTHIVTDAPCDSCHFNASTFLGARFNHGTALPGQCRNCHNGRQSMGKPASHSAGNKATNSCDQCHRSFTWFQASWNHSGVAIGGRTCATGSGCHGDAANQYTSSTAVSPVNHNLYTDTKQQCDVCHLSFVTWNVTMHEPQTGPCSSCHLNGASAQGQPANHSSFAGWPTECSQCHTSTVTWLNALASMPSNHIPYNTVTATCTTCHPAGLTQGNAILHNYIVVSPCTACHLAPAPYLSSVIQTNANKNNHPAVNKDCTACHKSNVGNYSRWMGGD